MINEISCPYCSADNMLGSLHHICDEIGAYEYATAHNCISCSKEMTLIVYDGGGLEIVGKTLSEYNKDELDYYHSLEGPSQEELDELEPDIDEGEIVLCDRENHSQTYQIRETTIDDYISYQQLLSEANGSYINYARLLRTVEWQQRRSDINIRDGHRCQSCRKIATDYSKDSLGNDDNWNGNYWIVPIAEIVHYPNLQFENIKGRDVDGSTVDLALIPSEKKYSLHVHHKFYVHLALPWQYEDDDLITVCNWCHWELHEKNSIPVFSRSSSGILTPLVFHACSRCNGAGMFPEYQHVQNGICFKCGGDRYLVGI